jgi:hypothetical protein
MATAPHAPFESYFRRAGGAMRRRRTALLVVAVALAAVASYLLVSVRSRGPAEVAVNPVPTPTALANYRLPLDSYRASDAETVTLNQAHGVLVARCMHQLGFPDYRPPAVTPVVRLEGPGDFGFLDLSRAAVYGFHDPRASAGKSPGDGRPSDTPAEIFALSGMDPRAAPGPTASDGRSGAPQGGCVGRAQRELYGGDSHPPGRVVAEMVRLSSERTAQDRRVIAATRLWAGCMATAGYTYRSPVDLETEQWAPRPTPTEVSIAVADVRCTVQTNLAGVGVGVLGAEERRLAKQHRTELIGERTAIDAALRRAVRILTEGVQ